MKKFPVYIFIVLMFCNIVLAQSSLPECEGNDIKNPLKKFAKSKKWTNCHGTFLDLKGKPAYVGEFYEGQPNGLGTFSHANRKYVGQWKKGKQHGQGTYTHASGKKYVGEWKNGEFHGRGTYTEVSGGIEIFSYVGEWEDGEWHGQGTLTFGDGTGTKAIFKKGEIVKELK